MRAALVTQWRTLVEGRAELGQGFLVIAGWALVTHGVASLAPRGHVWPLSAGLLLLSLAGWKWLAALVTKGLYVATLEESRRG